MNGLASLDKDILKKCLQYLSEDKNLRKMWHKLLGDEDTDMFLLLLLYYFKE